MKTCSKCKQSKAETDFVKSARYRDGFYPLCKSCRKAILQRRLTENPLCCRCKKEPHAKNHSYCNRCQRVVAGRTPERIRRKAISPELCPICNLRPKQESHGYCRKCAGEAHRNWISRQGGQWSYYTRNGNRHKLIARSRINTLVQRGKLVRKPCEVCGKLETEAHHDNHEKPLEIRWLCHDHHVALERWIRTRRKKTC